MTLSASTQRLPIRLFYASGVLAGTGAVLLSQARGSYGVVLWVGSVLLWHYAKSGIKWLALAGRLLIVVTVTGLFFQLFPQLISVPIQRIKQASVEISAISSAKTIEADTSVGIRLFLWDKAMHEIPMNLWLGLGHVLSEDEIQSWGVEANAPALKAIGHIHNNYLDAMFDSGLFGLGSFLSFLVGLLYMALRLFKSRPYASLGIAGILFMHATSSLTNVNFAHNYYPTMLSVAVSVCLLFFMKTSGSNDVALKN
jgi:O-antigen ligase